MAKEASVEIKSQPAVNLTSRDIKLRESAGNEWRVISPPGVTKERIEEPSFWACVADKLRPYDEITIIASDRSSHSRWLVLQAGHGYAEVHMLVWNQLPAMLASIGETLPSNHKLVFDTEAGWSAVRVSDGVVIVRGCNSQQECLQRLLTHASLKN